MNHGEKVSLADLTDKAARRLPVKVMNRTRQILCKYCSQFLAAGHQHLIEELVDFHLAKVNARRLVVPISFLFENLVTDEVQQKLVHVRHDLLLSNYTEDKDRPRGPATPASVSPRP